PHTDISCGCVTPFAATQFFLLRVSHAHGLARFPRQQRRNRPQACFVFAAKAAAQVGADNPYLIVRQSKDFSEFVTIAVDIPTSLPHSELISLPPSETVAGLQ